MALCHASKELEGGCDTSEAGKSAEDEHAEHRQSGETGGDHTCRRGERAGVSAQAHKAEATGPTSPVSVRTMLDGTGTQVKRNVDSENGTSATAVRRRRTFLRFDPDVRDVPREVYEYASAKQILNVSD